MATLGNCLLSVTVGEGSHSPASPPFDKASQVLSEVLTRLPTSDFWPAQVSYSSTF